MFFWEKRGNLFNYFKNTNRFSVFIAVFNCLVRFFFCCKLEFLLKYNFFSTQQKLTPFSLIINKMLLNYLRRIHSCNCFKNSKVYFVAVYTVLRFWLKIGRNSFHYSFHDKLIRFIIDDSAPVEQKLTLQVCLNGIITNRTSFTFFFKF